jgi:hypothetical protein
MSIELSRPPKPEESQKYSNFNGQTILWMDGWIIKVGEQIELELDSTKRRNVHKNERIKESP